MTWIREPNSEPIPGYRLIEPLGTGGFGEVWKCEAPGGLYKAIKFVYGNLNGSDQDSVRAEQEHRALQRIKEVRHPFVCSLDRIEIVDGELVIVMELADRTLHDLFQECLQAGMIGIARDNLMRYMRDVAEALDYMNEKHNLQHLDVKPRNLFLIGDRVKVADFGLVKHLERQNSSGLLGGVTPLYAPPETFLGKISPQSDQYSLAIVFQELLTGHRPFQAKNVRQLAQQHLKEEPDLRSLPESDRPILARALSKDPTKRFANCMALVSALYKSRIRKVEPPKPDAKKGTKTLAETMEDLALPDMDPSEIGVAEPEVVAAPAPPPRAPRLAPARVPRAPAANGAEVLDAERARPIEVSEMGVTVAQPENGALRPTLLIGLGHFGRRALMEIRCRLLDRFGDLNKIPIIRFLSLDTEEENHPQSPGKGTHQVSLARNDFFHMPLQPVGNYRRRNLDHLFEWLPREKLYSMPRCLQTQGSRALGRLAFTDHQQRLVARLRREIQEITNADRIYEAVSQTGLALRDAAPRVYVLAPAGGGSSGMLPDLGYALRRLLANLNFHHSTVTSFLMTGATLDPATPKQELANVYATLTELNHFNDSQVRFSAQYGADSQRIVDEGTPFNTTYLLPLANRSPDALDESIAHLGNYLFHEMITPLGLKLDNLRYQQEANRTYQPASLAASLRTFGTYNVWFPRGLLLHLAARQACKKLVEQWIASGASAVPDAVQIEIQNLFHKLTTNLEFSADKIQERIEQSSLTNSPTETALPPADHLAGMLNKLEEQSQEGAAQDDPAGWGKQAINRIREFVGTADESEMSEWRKTKLMRAMTAATQKVVEEWDRGMKADIHALMEHPGARIAAAEALLERLIKWCHKTADQQLEKQRQQAMKTTQVYRQLDQDLHELATNQGGFRFFGGRSRQRQLRLFLDHLGQFARYRLEEELLHAVRLAYSGLAGKLSDHARDLGICRQRLRHLVDSFERQDDEESEEDLNNTRAGDSTLSHSPAPTADAIFEVTRQSHTARVVLPEGQEHLESASLNFLRQLTPDNWRQLDLDVTERVLAPRGGLHNTCMSGGDMIKYFAVPLVQETSAILSQYLPVMDVADILRKELANLVTGNKAEAKRIVTENIREYLDRATPPLSRGKEEKEDIFLLTPASPSGKALAEAVVHVIPGMQVVRVSGQSDLMFLREQTGIPAPELNRILKPCRAAYEATAAAPNVSSHARFDILDWMPLDP
jgi:hypothetical protein